MERPFLEVIYYLLPNQEVPNYQLLPVDGYFRHRPLGGLIGPFSATNQEAIKILRDAETQASVRTCCLVAVRIFTDEEILVSIHHDGIPCYALADILHKFTCILHAWRRNRRIENVRQLKKLARRTNPKRFMRS